MDVRELIKLDSHKVRGNSNLLAIYINAFEKQFGKKPNCAGCTFANDWKRLILAVQGNSKPTVLTTSKNHTMKNTFKIKKSQGKILAYKANGRTYRLYDNKLNESFVIGFLTNGTPEQLKERKELFYVLPESLRETSEDKRIKKTDAYIKAENTGDKEAAQKTADDLSDFRKENNLIIEEEPKTKKPRAKKKKE